MDISFVRFGVSVHAGNKPAALRFTMTMQARWVPAYSSEVHQMSKSVYLAGPEVFYPDARVHGQHMQRVCRDAGFAGLFPLDAEIPPSPHGRSLAIFQANRAFIDRADAMVANLRDFRGFEPDSGTVWEVSYALARGKPVVGYCPSAATIAQRLQASPHGRLFDADCAIENFGLPLNLMLAHSLTAIAYGAEEDFLGLKAALAVLRGMSGMSVMSGSEKL